VKPVFCILILCRLPNSTHIDPVFDQREILSKLLFRIFQCFFINSEFFGFSGNVFHEKTATKTDCFSLSVGATRVLLSRALFGSQEEISGERGNQLCSNSTGQLSEGLVCALGNGVRPMLCLTFISFSKEAKFSLAVASEKFFQFFLEN
jgi:hypothetical protein